MSLRKQQSGSFVIEALISVLLLAVGLLSLMSIAVQANNQAGQSKYRNDASYLAGELIGEMWVSTVTPASFTGTTAWTTWNTRVASMLPSGDASSTTINGNEVDIVIKWSDKKDASVTHQYSTSALIQTNQTTKN